MRLTLRLLLTASVGLVCAWAQKGAAINSGNINPTNTPVQANQSPSPLGSRPRPILVSGSVAMDDGSPVSGSVKIQAVCGENHNDVGHTDATGNFGFQWNADNSGFEDATTAGPGGGLGVGITSYFGGGGASNGSSTSCVIKVDAPGYTSSSAPLNSYAKLDRFDAGTLILHKTTSDEGYTVSPLSLNAPKGAKKDFNKGNEEVKAKKFEAAEGSFQKAVAAYPQYADAWVSLGRVDLQVKSRTAARKHFQMAMDLDKKLLGPWQALGYMSWSESKWEDAARYLDQAVKLDPTDSSSWYFDAIADYYLGRFEAGERSIRAEIRLDQDRNAKSKFLLGMILLSRHDMKGGAEALRNFLKVSPTGPDADAAKAQLARAEGMASQ